MEGVQGWVWGIGGRGTREGHEDEGVAGGILWEGRQDWGGGGGEGAQESGGRATAGGA